MTWFEILLWTMFALGAFAGGVLYIEKVKTNPLILIELVVGWLQKSWPVFRPYVIKLALYVIASSPETQARARRESRQHDEPGKGRGPER